jgi:hypothetical protein
MKKLLIILILGSYYVVTAHTLTVVNQKTGASSYVGYNTYPVGVTVIPYGNGGNLLSNAVYTDFGLVLDGSSDITVCIDTGFSPAYSVDVTQGENMAVPLLAGIGCGFAWFGFGWILRLTKKVPGDF